MDTTTGITREITPSAPLRNTEVAISQAEVNKLRQLAENLRPRALQRMRGMPESRRARTSRMRKGAR